MQTIKLEGTALEIGQDVFIKVCAPMIAECAKGMNDVQLAHLYAGLVSACFGSMAADFGADQAISLFDMVANSFCDQAHALTTPHTVQ